MIKTKSNIILIGMPGSGKSTIGVILAKQISLAFIDTDILIQTNQKKTLQDIVDHQGHMALRDIEEKVLLNINYTNYIIATGGSAVYSNAAMTHLKKNGVVVFLDVDINTLKSRIKNFDTRGLAKKPDQTFEDLFHERSKLYAKYADLKFKCANITQEQAAFEIANKIKKLK